MNQAFSCFNLSYLFQLTLLQLISFTIRNHFCIIKLFQLSYNYAIKLIIYKPYSLSVSSVNKSIAIEE